MTALNSRVLAAALAFAALLVLIAWIAGFFTSKIDPELMAAQQTVMDESRLYTVKKMSPDRFDDIPATIVARDNTIVASRILSTVETVNVRAGDIVDAGDVLVSLDEADLKSRVEQAREHLNSVTAQLNDAERRLRRVRELRAQAVVSESELDAAQSAFDSLTAQSAQAEQALSEAEIVLGYATIRAPIEGRIVERRVEPGDTVSPGTPLVALYDPTSLRVEAAVPEQVALGLDIGEKLDISIPSLDKTMAGVVEEVVPAADSASRTFQVKAAIGVASQIRPGMFARFHIPLATPSVVAIPTSSITPVGQLDMVDVYTNGRIERRFVRLGEEVAGGYVEVLSGLTAGDRVVRRLPK